MTLDEYFGDHHESRQIFETVNQMLEVIGPAELRVTKSQVAFRRRVNFAFVWMPAMYLKHGDVPLVLTIGLRRRDPSPRWKQIVEPAAGRFTHHLELREPSDVDEQVRRWLEEAWSLAG